MAKKDARTLELLHKEFIKDFVTFWTEGVHAILMKGHKMVIINSPSWVKFPWFEFLANVNHVDTRF